MRKNKLYSVLVSYDDKTEIFSHITARTKQEAGLLVIMFFLTKNPKYNCRTLNSYRLKVVIEDNNGNVK